MCKQVSGMLYVVGLLFCSQAIGGSPAVKKEQASELVREALHREALGQNRERNQLLQAAQAIAPEQAQAQWAQGRVQYQKDWVALHTVPELVKSHRALTRYFAKRSDYSDTVEGQLDLADWCQKNGLPDQERAHLCRVIDLNPQHTQARDRLGFIRLGDQWISIAEMQAQERDAAMQLADLRHWQPIIAELRNDLEAKSSARRRAAAERLAKIDDATAITAIEAILCPTNVPIAHQAIATIKNIGDERAAQALARQSVYSPWPDVREACAKGLQERPMEQYVPLLVGSLYTTMEARVSVFRGPGNRLMHQQVFVREGQAQHEVAVLGTAYKRQAVAGGDARETSHRAKVRMFKQTMALQRQVAMQNLTTVVLNKRLTDALTLATGVAVGEQPDAWWQWWNDYNEVFIEGSKPVALNVVVREVKIQDLPPPPPQQLAQPADKNGKPTSETAGETPQTGARPTGSTDRLAERSRPAGLTDAQASAWNVGRGVAPATFDCLAAGTPVCTARGMTAVERIQVGDMVLSQDPESGELTYKPVLKTTIRPAGRLVRVEVGADEYFETSGGHLFWVSGEGWMKARDLKSGMLLHTPNGAVHVSSADPGSTAKTYNLIVADHHTYFAGASMVLSHDNTVRQPSMASVPGLTLK